MSFFKPKNCLATEKWLEGRRSRPYIAYKYSCINDNKYAKINDNITRTRTLAFTSIVSISLPFSSLSFLCLPLIKRASYLLLFQFLPFPLHTLFEWMFRACVCVCVSPSLPKLIFHLAMISNIYSISCVHFQKAQQSLARSLAHETKSKHTHCFYTYLICRNHSTNSSRHLSFCTLHSCLYILCVYCFRVFRFLLSSRLVVCKFFWGWRSFSLSTHSYIFWAIFTNCLFPLIIKKRFSKLFSFNFLVDAKYFLTFSHSSTHTHAQIHT